ncbi:MAG: ankyrin repeat domain-containing protein [Lachnospiraceae bacterium]|nr:ankyrin repeat domain-containing protein [Lachnospiraceae bacterium]
MDINELKKMLGDSLTSHQTKYIPWWTCEFNETLYRSHLITQQEVQQAEDCLANCDKATLTDTSCNGGLSLFHLLVWCNFYHAVEKILNDGALNIDVNITDGKGRGLTPLMLACCRANYNMAKLLIDHGADTGAVNTAGQNMWHILAYPHLEDFKNGFECQNYSMDQRGPIAELFSDGVNATNPEGLTPLTSLLQGENTNLSWALTEVFLKKGAQTDYVDEKGNTLLLMAIHKRHMTAALLLAKCDNMINTPNADGETPMQAAAKTYNEGLCLALKDAGANEDCEASRMDMANLSRITSNEFASFSVDDRDRISTALYLAKKLISKIDPDDDDDMGYLESILHNALVNDEKCQVLDLFQEAGIDFVAPIHSHGSVFCLRDKCISGRYGLYVIKKLIELGVDMDEAVLQGRTPANLLAACEKRNMMFSKQKDDYVESVAPLFTKESMEQIDNNGVCAVHWAARNGHLEMLQIMLEKGVNLNITQDQPAESGNTPLHVACIYGHSDIVKFLEENGGDSSIANINGELPAHHAVTKKKFGGDLDSKERAKVLRELKTLDGARNDGKTPLMLLMSTDISTINELLPIFLEKGVDVNATDNVGNTALILNTKNLNMCSKDAVKELVRAGADVNMADNTGNTALYYTLKYGHQEIARFLVKKGADYNHTNNKGENCVQIAVEKGYDTILELMTDIK